MIDFHEYSRSNCDVFINNVYPKLVHYCKLKFELITNSQSVLLIVIDLDLHDQWRHHWLLTPNTKRVQAAVQAMMQMTARAWTPIEYQPPPLNSPTTPRLLSVDGSLFRNRPRAIIPCSLTRRVIDISHPAYWNVSQVSYIHTDTCHRYPTHLVTHPDAGEEVQWHGSHGVIHLCTLQYTHRHNRPRPSYDADDWRFPGTHVCTWRYMTSHTHLRHQHAVCKYLFNVHLTVFYIHALSYLFVEGVQNNSYEIKWSRFINQNDY